MSDLAACNIQGRRLVSYFREYGPQTFKTADGRPLGRRSLQKKAIKFRLPIIPAGKGDPLIDPVAADEVLSRAALFQDDPSIRRGRTLVNPRRAPDAACKSKTPAFTAV